MEPVPPKSPESSVPQRRRYARYDVSPEKFLAAWQTSASLTEAAARLGMPKGITAARAAAYRKRGLMVKKMPRRTKPRLDVDRLNAFIENLGQEETAKQG